jgi:predicted amino acid racemase
MRLENLRWIGIGTNLTCYGGVIPTKDVYQKLLDVLTLCEKISGHKMMVVSGGNSSSVDLLIKGKLPTFVNELRIGEAIILGRETAYGTPILGFYDDVMTLEVELIELKTKPSKPEGEIGMDAFGETHHFEDRGLILRALAAIGRQDISIDHLIPPKGVKVLGASSDHLVLEILEGHYHVGDILTFKLTYGGILSLMTSRYVEKHYVR